MVGQKPNGAAAGMRGLLGGAAIMLAVALVAGTWNWSSSLREVRDREHPLPIAGCTGDVCARLSLQVDAREASTAEAALDVAFVQLALSMIGAFAVAGTLLYAHRAWSAAERSAMAAHDAIAVTERIGVAQVRAYLSTDQAQLKFDLNGFPSVSVQVKNSGQSPARDVWWEFAIMYPWEDGYYDWYSSFCPENINWATGVSIMTGETVHMGSQVHVSTPDEQLAKALRPEDVSQIVVRVRVKLYWHDVFDVRRTAANDFVFRGNPNLNQEYQLRG